jgi:TPR repeat protein
LGLGLAADIEQAERLYRAAAQAGHASAQLALGVILNSPDRGESSLREALDWYRAAAENGHSHALLRLGRAHELGLGVPQDLAAAKSFYRRAAALGLPEAGAENAAGEIRNPAET